MKKPSAPLALSTLALAVALTGTAGVSMSVSGTNDEAHIARLEQQVAGLLAKSDCMQYALALTNYTRPDGTTYLAPTKSAKFRRRWLVAMSPACAPKHPTKQDLSWNFPPIRKPVATEHLALSTTH